MTRLYQQTTTLYGENGLLTVVNQIGRKALYDTLGFKTNLFARRVKTWQVYLKMQFSIRLGR